MIYVFAIPTPANTSRWTPLKTPCPIEEGVVTRLHVLLPPGCAGLVGLHIDHGIHQIWPKNTDGWFKGEGDFPFEEKQYIPEPPYVLDVYSYNDDDTYEHEPLVMLDVARIDQEIAIDRLFTVEDIEAIREEIPPGEELPPIEEEIPPWEEEEEPVG